MPKCVCPFCDSELDMAVSFCQVCKATILYCTECNISVEKGHTHCPRCGRPLSRATPTDKPA